MKKLSKISPSVAGLDCPAVPAQRAAQADVLNRTPDACEVMLNNPGGGIRSNVPAQRHPNLGCLTGRSRLMQVLYSEILMSAPTDANVLITGESGTGKELVAKAIHDNSHRAEMPYLQVHCAALPEHLLEAELFGHSKGAFTGAVSDRPGRFEAAAGGTLLLDEIGEVPLSTQVKLLRVLQEREVVRLGENAPRKVDVRIIAATHRDLPEMVKHGHFRADLYYRLCVLPLYVPPLRERREDIPLLADSILSDLMNRYKRNDISLSSQAIDTLVAHDWPGNVRELVNAMEYALVHTDSAAIKPRHFPAELLKTAPAFVVAEALRKDAPLTRYYRGASEPSEQEIILTALNETGGNKSIAAEKLGMSRTTLWKRLKRYGIA